MRVGGLEVSSEIDIEMTLSVDHQTLVIRTEGNASHL